MKDNNKTSRLYIRISDEENKMINETKKILKKDIDITAFHSFFYKENPITDFIISSCSLVKLRFRP